MQSSPTRRRGVAAALRRLSPGTVALIAGVLAFVLLIYVLGPASTWRVLICLGLGAFVGWLGSLILSSDTQQGILLDILAGAAGALAGLLLFGGTISGGGTVEFLLSSILGAIALVTAFGLIRRGRSPVKHSNSAPTAGHGNRTVSR